MTQKEDWRIVCDREKEKERLYSVVYLVILSDLYWVVPYVTTKIKFFITL